MELRKSVLGFAALLIMAPLPSLALHVIVDPGHGGHDHGATRGKIYESTITLKVGRHLANLLSQDPKFTTTMTRNSDRFVALSERTKLADRKSGEIFISIHVNSSKDHRARGGEIYFQNQLPADEESMFLASLESEGHGADKEQAPKASLMAQGFKSYKPDIRNIIFDLHQNARLFMSSELSKTLVKNWTGNRKSKRNTIRQAPFYVVSNTDMPSTLVELGYLSNPREAKKLTSDSYQRRLARGLYEGLKHFKDFMDKDPYSRLN